MTKQLRHKKLHTLVRDAVRDLVKVSKDKKYRLDMGNWHVPNGQCAVCVAGAVIAKRLNVSSRRNLCPSSFDDETARRLEALNDIRTGDIHWTLSQRLSFPHTQAQADTLKAAWSKGMLRPDDVGEKAFLDAWRSFARKAKEVGI